MAELSIILFDVLGSSPYTRGTNVTVDLTVQNDGEVAAGPFEVGLYLSVDTTITAGPPDIFLGVANFGSGLGVGSSPASPTVTITLSVSAGSYYLAAIVDHQGVVAEENESNNVHGGSLIQVDDPPPPGQADLVVDQVTFSPGTVHTTSGFLNFEVTIRNQGGNTASASQAKVHVSTDQSTANAVTDEFCTVGSLGAGGTFVCQGNVDAPSSAGAYYFIGEADSQEAVTESDEGNNEQVANDQVTVVASNPSGPNLEFSGSSPFPALQTSGLLWKHPGQSFKVQTNYLNGAQPHAFDFRVAVYLSTDTTITESDILVMSCEVQHLPPSEIRPCGNIGSEDATVPIGTAPGWYHLGVLLDDRGDVLETDELDNVIVASTQFQVLEPVGVTVSPVSTSLTAAQTQKFSAAVTGNPFDTDVTWEISPQTGTIDATGLYTAPSVISQLETVTVTAKSDAVPSSLDTATINLLPTTISINPLSVTLAPLQPQQFAATVEGAPSGDVTWSLTPTVGSGTISTAGLYTAPPMVNFPTAITVTATSVSSPTVSVDAAVNLVPPLTGGAGGGTGIGIFRTGTWLLDYNLSGAWEGEPSDILGSLGQAGDVAVIGDWDGNGRDKIGFFRNGMWLLDLNGDGDWNGPSVDANQSLGQAGDVPIVGDWNGDGRSKIGIFRNGTWLLDYNGNGAWDGSGTDVLGSLGQTGDIPVVGDWNGDGRDEFGLFRDADGLWLLDYNGNGAWDDPTVDRSYLIGQSGDTPVVGDWTGDGTSKLGVFRNGTWELDFDGNGL